MRLAKKGLSAILIGAISIGSYMGVTSLVRDVRFAKAEDQVQASREDLKKVDDLAGVYRAVGKAVEPSVVKIDVIKTIKGVHRGMNGMPFDDDLLRRFFQDPGNQNPQQSPHGRRFNLPNNPPDDNNGNNGNGGNNGNDDNNNNGNDDQNNDEYDQEASGSGVIMEAADGKGYILTNNHVAGGADKLIVTLWDGRQIHKTKVLGTDPKSDLAVVQIEADKLIPAQWGDSDQLEKGDIIFAFGAPFGYVGSMTHGIVSALNRQDIGILGRQDFRYENFIQVDAPINPGNSGGPLVNLHGEVVGINTAIATETGAFNGLGFAIPSDQAKNVYSQLKDSGKMVRGFIGVGIQDLKDPDLAKSFGYTGDGGVLIGQTWEDTPASGKLQKGDIVTAINGKPVKDSNALRTTVANTKPGTELSFSVFHKGKTEDVKIKIGEQPEEMADIRKHGGAGEADNSASSSSEQAENPTKSLGLHLASPNDEIVQRFNLDQDAKGAVVTSVDRRSPAARAGIFPGDVITQVGDQNITTAKEATDALAKQDLAKGIRLSVANQQGSRFVLMREEDK